MGITWSGGLVASAEGDLGFVWGGAFCLEGFFFISLFGSLVYCEQQVTVIAQCISSGVLRCTALLN